MGQKILCNDGRLSFWCPGCSKIHQITVNGPGGWTFDGDDEWPTLTPSILVRGGHFAKNQPPGNCWCDFTERTGRVADFTCERCHCFVTAGKILYLQDCSHGLAGQVIALPDLPKEFTCA